MTTPRMRIQPRQFSPLSSRGLIPLLPVLLLAFSAHALAANETYDTALSADRARAQKEIKETAAVSELLKSKVLPRMATIEAESSTIKTNLTDLQKTLLTALTRDDTSEIQTIRALLSARQAQLDANETEKNLLQRELDELDRDREVWKRRVATMDLALRMDMNVMLAGPAEIEAREKRVEAAQKEMSSQAGQEQKYRTRMTTTLLDLEATRARMKALSKNLLSPTTPALQRARQEEITALQHLEACQAAFYLVNTILANHAQRNLAFARTDLLVWIKALIKGWLWSHSVWLSTKTGAMVLSNFIRFFIVIVLSWWSQHFYCQAARTRVDPGGQSCLLRELLALPRAFPYFQVSGLAWCGGVDQARLPEDAIHRSERLLVRAFRSRRSLQVHQHRLHHPLHSFDLRAEPFVVVFEQLIGLVVLDSLQSVLEHLGQPAACLILSGFNRNDLADQAWLPEGVVESFERTCILFLGVWRGIQVRPKRPHHPLYADQLRGEPFVLKPTVLNGIIGIEQHV